jgi:hypothetical protein
VISWRLFASDQKLFWCGRCGAITVATVLGADIEWQGPQDPPVVVNLPIGPPTPVKNRAKRARERAGLTYGQAARLLNMPSGDLMGLEERDSEFANADHTKLAEIYGVNVEWLRGDSDRCDYDSIKDVRGYDELSFHDRDVVAEFAASLPPAKPCATCGKLGCHPFRHAGWDPNKDKE